MIENLKHLKEDRRLALNVGWITYLIMFMLFFFSFQLHNGMLGVLSLVGYVGAVIGNTIRLYSRPNMYTSDGTLWGSFRKRLFWNHGPQVIGFFTIYFVLIFMGSFFNK